MKMNLPKQSDILAKVGRGNTRVCSVPAAPRSAAASSDSFRIMKLAKKAMKMTFPKTIWRIARGARGNAHLAAETFRLAAEPSHLAAHKKP